MSAVVVGSRWIEKGPPVPYESRATVVAVRGSGDFGSVQYQYDDGKVTGSCFVASFRSRFRPLDESEAS